MGKHTTITYWDAGCEGDYLAPLRLYLDPENGDTVIKSAGAIRPDDEDFTVSWTFPDVDEATADRIVCEKLWPLLETVAYGYRGTLVDGELEWGLEDFAVEAFDAVSRILQEVTK